MMQNAITAAAAELTGDDIVHVEFARFFATAKQPMMRLAFLLTASPQQSEDAVQDSFIRVLEKWSQINDPASYMRRAVVNRCMSWHRHTAVVRRTQSQVATADSYTDQPDEILDALLHLPQRRRAVVVLTYYEHLDTDAIGAVLGISTATVRSTLHRALAQLKGILG